MADDSLIEEMRVALAADRAHGARRAPRLPDTLSAAARPPLLTGPARRGLLRRLLRRR